MGERVDEADDGRALEPRQPGLAEGDDRVAGALVDVAATAGSCAGDAEPSAANVDTAIATAVASIVTGVNEQNKEFQTKIAALVVDVAALIVLANELRAALTEKGLIKGAA